MSIYFFVDYPFSVHYMISMVTKKPRILLTIDEKLLNRIDDFRFENRINTRSEAIRRLLEEALKGYEKKTEK
jgi:metal-responsive CopG/Arc/MetJ family transcriptional regulator